MTNSRCIGTSVRKCYLSFGGGRGGVRLNHRRQKRLRCFLGGEVIRLSRKLVGRGVVNVFSSHVGLNATSAKYNFIRNFIEIPSNNFFISSRMTRSQIVFKLSFSTFLPSDKSSRAKSLEPYRQSRGQYVSYAGGW